MDLKKIRVDPKKRDNGVWFDYDDETSFLLRSYQSKAVKDTQDKVRKPYAKRLLRGTLSGDKIDELAMQVISSSVILDWKGVTDGGKAVKYTAARGMELLTKSESVRAEIADFAHDENNYLDDEIEEGLDAGKKS